MWVCTSTFAFLFSHVSTEYITIIRRAGKPDLGIGSGEIVTMYAWGLYNRNIINHKHHKSPPPPHHTTSDNIASRCRCRASRLRMCQAMAIPAARRRRRPCRAGTARSAFDASNMFSAMRGRIRRKSPFNAPAARHLGDGMRSFLKLIWSILFLLILTFRDLLVRHDKLVHLNEGKKEANPNQPPATRNKVAVKAQMSPPNTATIPNLIDPDLLAQQTSYSQLADMRGRAPDATMQHRLPCSLDLLSDAATHIASSGNHQLPSIIPQLAQSGQERMEPESKRARTTSFNSRGQDEVTMKNSAYHPGGDVGLLGDYNIFLDDFGISSHVFPPLDTEVPVAMWSRPQGHEQSYGYGDQQRGNHDVLHNNNDQHQYGRFVSRLSSTQPDYQDPSNGSRANEDNRNGPPWKVSSQDHRYIQSKLDDFAAVLPKGFELPSRHTLSRFLEGYINGFHEHLPFLHIPTVQLANLAPELLLAIAAIGAQYRFEEHRGYRLWYASRAVAVEQTRRRSSSQVLEILSPPATYRSESAGLSPPSTARNQSIAEVSGISRNGSEGNGIDTL